MLGPLTWTKGGSPERTDAITIESSVLGGLFGLAVLVALRFAREQHIPSALGRWRPPARGWTAALLAICALLPLMASDALPPTALATDGLLTLSADRLAAAARPVGAGVPLLLLAVVTMQELLFRGWMRRDGGIIFQAVVFAGVFFPHDPARGALIALVLGAVVRAGGGSVLPAIAAHVRRGMGRWEPRARWSPRLGGAHPGHPRRARTRVAARRPLMSPVVLDGAMGTWLETQGHRQPAPEWTTHTLRQAPDAVAAAHANYAHAGATVHTAATFRTAPYVLGDAASRWTGLAVDLARASVPADHRVAGSVAPLEDCYRPDRSPPDAYAHHLRTCTLLADAGVDLLLVETFAHVDEAVHATKAAARTGLPVWTALTPGPDGTLLSPEALADGARAVADAGAAMVAVNCVPARRAMPWVRALAATGLPWGIYANAGPREDGLWTGTAGAADRYAACAYAWASEGAAMLGGCCGTGPDHIRALAGLTSAQEPMDDDRCGR